MQNILYLDNSNERDGQVDHPVCALALIRLWGSHETIDTPHCSVCPPPFRPQLAPDHPPLARGNIQLS